MTSRAIGALFVAALVLVPAAAAGAQPAPCDAATLRRVLEPATETSRSVEIACDLTLQPHHVVTRQIVLTGARASGVTVECNGATIDGRGVNRMTDMVQVRSRTFVDANGVRQWERPEDVRVRGCRIHGAVRVMGMSRNGEGGYLYESSRLPGHVARARAAAPTRVLLEDLWIEAHGRTPLYVAPGVTYLTLQRSELLGEAQSVALYLDTESYRNVVRDNYIHTRNPREQLAIDGSSHNRIYGNRFSALDSGGIYLYRNCGEQGTIRITTPSYNEIIDNVFFYDVYRGSAPAVYLGSRDGNRSYCGADRGYPYGSSTDDRDFARFNAVLGNQIYRRDASEMIVVRYPATNTDNVIAENVTVSVPESRRVGCYAAFGFLSPYVPHGEVLELFRDTRGQPYCSRRSYVCADGALVGLASTSCDMVEQPFACAITGSNLGCAGVARCPGGRTPVAASAVCDLESGPPDASRLASFPPGVLEVTESSSVVSDGACWVADTRAQSGRATITGVLESGPSVDFGCRERDRNGGDCHVRGVLYCY